MKENIFKKIPADVPEELFETLVQSKDLRVERIVSHGQSSPEGFWYDQPSHEWVILLAGAAEISYEDGTSIKLLPGDYLDIPATTKHRVEWTSEREKTIWLAIHYE